MKNGINNTDGDGVDCVSPEDLARCGILVHGFGGVGKLASGELLWWHVAETPEGHAVRAGTPGVSSAVFHTEGPVIEALEVAVKDISAFLANFRAKAAGRKEGE
jgi:hypothetical protein